MERATALERALYWINGAGVRENGSSSRQELTSAKSCNLTEMKGFWEKSSWIGIALFTKITSSSFKYGSCSILSPLLGVGYKGGLSFETIRKSDFCGISGKSPSQRHMSKKGDNKKIRFRLTVIWVIWDDSASEASLQHVLLWDNLDCYAVQCGGTQNYNSFFFTIGNLRIATCSVGSCVRLFSRSSPISQTSLYDTIFQIIWQNLNILTQFQIKKSCLGRFTQKFRLRNIKMHCILRKDISWTSRFLMLGSRRNVSHRRHL